MFAEAELPKSVRHCDGTLEPFEPERITRQLFAATERIGTPNAFLARELTESILHFLVADSDGPISTPEQIADVACKVIRELGHRELARSYKDRHLTSTTGRGNRPVAPRSAISDVDAVFSRELIHAHSEGLIELSGLNAPSKLAGLVVIVPLDDVHERIETARHIAGEFIALDGPEYELQSIAGEPSGIVRHFLQQLSVASRQFGLRVVLNLNASAPSRHAAAHGPLFGGTEDGQVASRRVELARELAEQAHGFGLTIWWHSRPKEGAVTDQSIFGRMQSNFEVVFDRGDIVQLGPGIDRRSPAALLQVGINLGRMVEILGGPPVDPAVLLTKVASLTRFAKTAAHAKLDFLRKHGRPELREGFLLERARLLLSPLRLEETSRASDRSPAELAKEIIQTIRSAAEKDRPRQIPVRVDTGLDGECWEIAEDLDRPFRQRLRSLGSLQSAAGAGCSYVSLNRLASDGVDLSETIEAAAQTGISRLRFRP